MRREGIPSVVAMSGSKRQIRMGRRKSSRIRTLTELMAKAIHRSESDRLMMEPNSQSSIFCCRPSLTSTMKPAAKAVVCRMERAVSWFSRDVRETKREPRPTSRAATTAPVSRLQRVRPKRSTATAIPGSRAQESVPIWRADFFRITSPLTKPLAKPIMTQASRDRCAMGSRRNWRKSSIMKLGVPVEVPFRMSPGCVRG